MGERILTNAKLVLIDRVVEGTVLLRDGLIGEICEGRSAVQSAVDCESDLLLPGLVELHTDNMDRHMLPRPRSSWPIEAAVINHDREIVNAGITTVFDALGVGEITPDSVRAKLARQYPDGLRAQKDDGALKADHFLHLRCEISDAHLVDWLDDLVDRPEVRLMSVMDHTPGQRQFAKIETYANFYQKKFDLSDEEVMAFMAKRRIEQEKNGAPNRRIVVAMAKERGIALASHDDATLEHVDEAVRDGVSIAEFPTTVEAAEASHGAGMAVLMGGPNIVRGQSHSGNTSARELAERGLLDIISSDYVPSSLLFAALLLARRIEGVSLPEAIKAITLTPARRVGLDDRGKIAVGLRADLIRVRPAESAPVVRSVWKQGERIA